ncbi:MAG: DUF5679 domain-containing protein [Aggregatilineales bacterium]
MDDYHDFEEEIIEGYCVRCRESIDIENPQAVWTRKGMPATRGECSICGGTVFRMGKTEMHSEHERPSAIEIGDSAKRSRPKLERNTVYVAFAEADEGLARQLAEDLTNAGIATWLHEHDGETVNWAGGVHPALKECNQMVYVLSETSVGDAALDTLWQFFREKRKPIIIAQIANTAPPDPIRRSPRFDMVANYKSSFRQMIQALST